MSLPAQVDYLRDIKPVLAERCYACHGALEQEAGLRLDTAERIRQGSARGKVLLPGNAAKSELLRRISHPDEAERMPLEGRPLTPTQIEQIRQWILTGAPLPEDEKPDEDPRDHWAFQPIRRPALPATGPDHPIDAFLARSQRARQLRPQPGAERSLLIRRLYLDLTGLAPSPAQLRDERPWERIVDELLALPQHGERWARHWMDVWRYSDWYGLGQQLRYSQKHLWRWRDWIVESLNRDTGYDRMILEMIAGDELAPGQPGVLRATGFLARNYYLFNRTTWLDNTIEHTSKAFLGLTLNCAKCHDHKYDPVTMTDYYRFRAIFEPHQVRLDPVPGVTDFEQDGLPRVFDNHPEAPTYLHQDGDPKNPDTAKRISPGVPKFLESFAPEIRPVALPAAAFAPVTREGVREDRLRSARQRVLAARSKVTAADQTVAAGKGSNRQEESPRAAQRALIAARAELSAMEAQEAALRAVIEADVARFTQAGDRPFQALAAKAARLQAQARVAKASANVITQEGSDAAKLEQAKKDLREAQEFLQATEAGGMEYTSLRVTKKALESPADNEDQYPTHYPRQSTGRRLALARWMVSPENPLTARVAVNHVWMRHFGEPLVESVFDFGRRAPPPEHLDLLNFLAAGFMESGWSLRWLHRLMVTSEAYRRSSSSAGADGDTLTADPSNRYYWRMHPRRMEAQVIRDNLLHLAGTLDLRIGGPSVEPDNGSFRRSLYLKHSRDQQDKFLGMFDDADHLQCYRRIESIVPQQALALSNSRISLEMAERIAARLRPEAPGFEAYVEAAFEALLGRRPDRAEQEACGAFRAEMRDLRHESGEDHMRIRLVHALLNHNDFVTIR